MAKKKTGRKGKKSAPAQKPQVRSVVPRAPRQVMARGNSVAAFVNPWSQSRGKKWPDADSSFSVSYRSRTVGTIGSNSDGTLRWARFGPGLAGPMYLAPDYTTGPPTVFPITSSGSSSSVADYSDFGTIFQKYRIVTWGIRVTSVGKPLNASGWLTVDTHAMGDQYSINPSQMALRRDVIPIQNGTSFVWISQPLSNAAMEYESLSFTVANLGSSWTGVTVMAEGCSTDVVLRFELVCDLEFLPLASEITTRLASPSATYDVGSLSNIFNTFKSTVVEQGVSEGSLRASQFSTLPSYAYQQLRSGFMDGVFSAGHSLATSGAQYAASMAAGALMGRRAAGGQRFQLLN